MSRGEELSLRGEMCVIKDGGSFQLLLSLEEDTQQRAKMRKMAQNRVFWDSLSLCVTPMEEIQREKVCVQFLA